MILKRGIGKAIYPIALFSLIFFFSCGSYQKILKSDDVNLKFEAAKKYYNEGAYHKALPIFEDLLTYYRGTVQGEKIYFYYAYCQYGVGNNQLASFRFKTFYETYPNSEHAEESLYMYAYCLYLESPPVSLDQTTTQKAIEAFQLFTIKFPNSDRISDCNKYIDALRDKIEKKSIKNAKLFYKIEDYKAAVWAIQNLLEDYPATDDREELEFLILKSQYKLAENSIESKIEERLYETLRYYRIFNTNFPESKLSDEAQNIYENALKDIDKLKSKSNG